jgi:6-phosphogluconolactonase
MSRAIPALLLYALGYIMAAPATAQAPDPRQFLYVGTSNARGSEGLYVYELDPAGVAPRLVQVVSDRRGPGFQAIHPTGRYLYSVSSHRFVEGGRHGTISAYRIEPASGRLTLLNERPALGSTHLSVDPLGRFAYVSDYGGATLSVHGIAADGRLTDALDVVHHEGRSVHPERQAAPFVHSAIPSPDGRFLYMSAMGLDRIYVYAVDPETGRLSPGAVPYVETSPGTGPRHFAVRPDGAFAYSVEEILHSVSAYGIDSATGALRPIQRLDLVPAGMDTTGMRISAADVHTSPDGRFLYVTNRGDDRLVVYAIDADRGTLTRVGSAVTGEHPRAFGIAPRGEFVFVAARDDDEVVVFRRDELSGLVEPASRIAVPAPTSTTAVLFE